MVDPILQWVRRKIILCFALEITLELIAVIPNKSSPFFFFQSGKSPACGTSPGSRDVVVVGGRAEATLGEATSSSRILFVFELLGLYSDVQTNSTVDLAFAIQSSLSSHSVSKYLYFISGFNVTARKCAGTKSVNV